MDDTAVICGIEVAFGRRTRDEVAALTFEYLDGLRNGSEPVDGAGEPVEREEVASVMN